MVKDGIERDGRGSGPRSRHVFLGQRDDTLFLGEAVGTLADFSERVKVVVREIAALDEAAKRIESLAKNETPWMSGSGQKVLGFYSKIDDSPQPYGVEIPEGLEWGANQKSVPMWIWLP